MISAETPLKIWVPHPINEWTDGSYFLCNSSSEGIQEVTEYWQANMYCRVKSNKNNF